MKRILIFLLTGIVLSYAQVAPNWTLNDCSGTSYSLYDKLDSQEVVMMFFVMGCGFCTQVGDYIDRMNDRYDISHPGKVNFYLMDYYPSNTCYDVDTTWNTHHFDACFSGCWNVKDYYFPTLYPMPAIVVAGGSTHTILYQNISWQFSDTTLIENSINAVIDNLAVGDEDISGSVSVFPNPAGETVQIRFNSQLLQHPEIRMYTSTGKEITCFKADLAQGCIQIDFTNVEPGEYIIELKSSGKKVLKKLMVRP